MYIRVNYPRAFFDLRADRKLNTALLSNVRSVCASRYTAMHVARSDREQPPRVLPLSWNAISRPFTTNVSDARIVYVTRGTDVPKAGSDFFPWVSKSATMCTSHLLRSTRYEIRRQKEKREKEAERGEKKETGREKERESATF
ncbi:hypothetical protein ALC62_05749 [Cyphomyrmex costatus]|uniref:Uncharacterized protein n=1 Tax=Cyphomyrmex costatus TaxID=456900 RepID=A0A195CS79_9HYME|nr:hypothetical protein ALC62_05749 [Cyphomyrmex costatus]